MLVVAWYGGLTGIGSGISMVIVSMPMADRGKEGEGDVPGWLPFGSKPLFRGT